ncbi:MAG: alkaline phosphatase family protein [Acidobacteriota bacterium]
MSAGKGATKGNTEEQRLVMLGIDGLPPQALDRFRREGDLPHWDRLHREGARMELIPPLPPLTAPSWMTIASGAHPAALGVTSILQPKRGEAPNRVFNGFDRRGIAAEYLWDRMAREGQPTIVLKYPGSWPPRRPEVIQVDGAGGYADITCRFDVVESLLYSTAAPAVEPAALGVPSGYGEHWRIDAGSAPGSQRLIPRDPLGWRGLPKGCEPVFEAALPVASRGGGRLVLSALAGRDEEGRETLWIGPNKNLSKQLGEPPVALRPGDWSPWQFLTFGKASCALRFKLRGLDLEERALTLYRSAGHAREGFTQPPNLAEELERAIGPVVEWTGTFDFFNGLADLETQLEIYQQHTKWLQDALDWLAQSYPWRALFTQWHVLEYAHHIAGSALSPEHPRHAHRREELLDFLRQTYRLGDQLVGSARRLVRDDDTLVVLGDHGHALVHTLFFLNALLRETGWLHLRPDGTVDWGRSRAYGLYPGFVLLNSTEHWSQGIVSPAEAPPLLRQLTQLLRGVRDPRTGEHPVSAVIPREEMDAWGQAWTQNQAQAQGQTDRAEAALPRDPQRAFPDLYFTVDEGYEVASRLPQDGALFQVTEPGEELTSGHGSFHPTSRAARTLGFFCGPAFAPGSSASTPAAMVDLAPTFAELLGVSPLGDADGRPLSLQRLGIARGAIR